MVDAECLWSDYVRSWRSRLHQRRTDCSLESSLVIDSGERSELDAFVVVVVPIEEFTLDVGSLMAVPRHRADLLFECLAALDRSPSVVGITLQCSRQPQRRNQNLVAP